MFLSFDRIGDVMSFHPLMERRREKACICVMLVNELIHISRACMCRGVQQHLAVNRFK